MTQTGTRKGRSDGRRMRGFEPASGLLRDRIRTAGESRGFAVSRLLTAWAEVVGAQTAAITRPVSVSYGKGGFGATLTVLVQSAHAPMVQMQVPLLCEKVNAVYGYAAIRRILLTQTAPPGFAEGQAQFAPAPAVERAPDPAMVAKAAEMARGVQDDGLRDALERLAQNFQARDSEKRGKA